MSTKPISSLVSLPLRKTETSLRDAFVKAINLPGATRPTDMYIVYQTGDTQKFEAITAHDADAINHAFCYRGDKHILFVSLMFTFHNMPATIYGKEVDNGQLLELIHQADTDSAEEFLRAAAKN